MLSKYKIYTSIFYFATVITVSVRKKQHMQSYRGMKQHDLGNSKSLVLLVVGRL